MNEIQLIALLTLFGASSAVAFKAGYSVRKSLLIGLGLCIPVINLIVLIGFVAGEWPVQRQLRTLRESAGITPERVSEPASCVACGAEIPGGSVTCPACGWTYKDSA